MRYILLLFFTISALLLQAQINREVDSLNTVLNTGAKEDTLRLNRLGAITWRYRFMDSIATARGMANNAITLADKIVSIEKDSRTTKKVLVIKADCYLEIASTYPQQKEQYEYMQQALETYKQARDTNGICRVLAMQQNICKEMSYYTRAAQIGQERLNFAFAKNDSAEIVAALKDKAADCLDAKDYTNAIKFTRQTANYKATDDRFYFSLASLFSKTKNCDSAFYYVRLPQNDSAPDADLFFVHSRYVETPGIFLACGDTAQAIAALVKAQAVFENINYHTLAIIACYKLSEIYLAQGDIKLAKQYCAHTLEHIHTLDGKSKEVIKLNRFTVSMDVDVQKDRANVYHLQAIISKAEKNYQQALEYETLYSNLSDSITLKEKATNNQHLQQQFELNQVVEEQNRAKAKAEKEMQRQRFIQYGVTAGLGLTALFLIVTFVQMQRVRKEKKRGDDLLLNILPSQIAEELKQKGEAEAKLFDDVTVLYTDFKNFTLFSETVTPQVLVNELNECFKAFDRIIDKYHIEKIKTVGDAYMAASGLPVANPNHAVDMVHTAIEIRDFMLNRKNAMGINTFEIRIGVHSGKVVAGIVGLKKYAYDIWGDTVNTAARMEQNSEAGKINISESTYQLVKDKFSCQYRGEISAKNKGELKMYFVEG